MSVGSTCQHCRSPRVTRPRGLCWTCYYTPGIAAMYRSASKYANRGLMACLNPQALPLPVPTRAVPGSPDKVAVLESRAAAGEALWHPADLHFDAVPL